MHIFVYVHAFYLLVHSEWHAGATLRMMGLFALLAMPGQMAPVTGRGGGAMEGKKRKEGAVSHPLTVLEWPVPGATTSADHLLQANPAPLSSSHSLMFTFSFPMGGRWGAGGAGGRAVFSQAVCPYFCDFSMPV